MLIAVAISAAGYMACICYGFFIMLGTVGWRASLMFVRHIYKVTIWHVKALAVRAAYHNTMPMIP